MFQCSVNLKIFICTLLLEISGAIIRSVINDHLSSFALYVCFFAFTEHKSFFKKITDLHQSHHLFYFMSSIFILNTFLKHNLFSYRLLSKGVAQHVLQAIWHEKFSCLNCLSTCYHWSSLCVWSIIEVIVAETVMHNLSSVACKSSLSSAAAFLLLSFSGLCFVLIF